MRFSALACEDRISLVLCLWTLAISAFLSFQLLFNLRTLLTSSWVFSFLAIAWKLKAVEWENCRVCFICFFSVWIALLCCLTFNVFKTVFHIFCLLKFVSVKKRKSSSSSVFTGRCFPHFLILKLFFPLRYFHTLFLIWLMLLENILQGKIYSSCSFQFFFKKIS